MADSLLVTAPADYVPRTAISFGSAAETAIAVDETTPLPVSAGAPGAQSVTLAGGSALTAAVDLGGQRLHRLFVPAGWTAAAVSFQSSHDGVLFADLYDANGEVVLASAVVSGGARAIVVDPAAFLGIRYLKVRSGTGAAPVNQGAARDLSLVTVAR